MKGYVLIICCAFAIVSGAMAQTKTSGTVDCGKPDKTYSLQVPDDKDRTYVIAQYKCSWTSPYVVEGQPSTQNVFVESDEQNRTSGRSTSTGYTEYKNGDRAYWRWVGTYDTKAMTASGNWTYIRGTGKLEGIRGSGTGSCKLKSSESGGGSICEVKGEYKLPAAKK